MRVNMVCDGVIAFAGIGVHNTMFDLIASLFLFIILVIKLFKLLKDEPEFSVNVRCCNHDNARRVEGHAVETVGQ